jgi:hypothetical protein
MEAREEGAGSNGMAPALSHYDKAVDFLSERGKIIRN